MEIKPLAFDSLGVRSEATFVETDDVKILIDPGAALGPRRYSLPPHKLEIEKLVELTDIIRDHAAKADILIISHFHYDHYTSEPELYEDKILLIKHPKENINKSQRQRSKDFLDSIDELPKEIHYADGQEFEFGGTQIKFSPAVYHGKVGARLGFVIMVSISNREKFLFGSDCEGPLDPNGVEWIVQQNPDILVQDGLATIFLGWMEPRKNLDIANENCIRILEETKLKTMILDHHLVRDLEFRKKIKPVLDKAKKLNKKVITAAEFLGKKNNFLEAKRKELYKLMKIRNIPEHPKNQLYFLRRRPDPKFKRSLKRIN